MDIFGIYIAKFDEKILNNKDYKGIKNSYVIGEVNLGAKKYGDQKTVDEICKARIKEEARRNNGKNGFKAEIIDWNKSVKDFAFIVIEDEKNKVDDRIRNTLEWYNFGKPVSGSNKNEFFLFNEEKLKALDIAKIIETCTKNPVDCARNDSWTFYDFQKEIIKQGKEKLKNFGELLLYLFCRVGKSAISLQIAKEITNTNHILILTTFPSAKDSFKKYTVNHTEMLGYDFLDKDNLSEEALMESEKCIVFLSTNALRVKTDLEDEDDNSDEAEGEEIIYERIDLLRKADQFDVLIVDETHNGISSPATNRLISKAKEVLGVKYIIHNSATPFNDFKSNRFNREQTIQVDFLTILQNNWLSFPNLNTVSLPFYEDEKLTVKALKSAKGKHKLLFWSATIKSCKDFVTKYKGYFESNGIKIEYIDDLQGSTVEDKINTFQAENSKTIIVSCDKGHTGCTYPKCDCVILARDLYSAERLVQIMSRCLTPDDGKEEVYFYTIGTENKYKAVSELKRNNNAANNHQTTKAFEDALKAGKLSIKSASFKGEDLKEYEAPLEEVLREIAEFSASLDSIEKDINVDVANVTIEDVMDFSTYTESGISKATRSLLTLFKEQGKRKVKEVQSKDAEELCEQLKKRINEKGTKKDKNKVEEYTLEELLTYWFINVLKSLNTWLLCKDIEKFEDIVEYVAKENQFTDKEKDTFAILAFNNENLLKNFIIAHNEVFVKFEDKNLYEKSNMNLRKFLSKDFDVNIEEVGGGYLEEYVKKIVRMASVDWYKKDLKVVIYDDIYLEVTKAVLDNYNINDMNLYYICSNREVGKLLRKAYSIPLNHILYQSHDKDGLYYIAGENGTFYYNINMSFDSLIANPPYGKRGTLATTIIKSFMKVAKECIVLCQPRSIEKPGVYEHVVKADIVPNYFDAGLGDLAVSRIRKDYTEGKQILYGKREIQETDITFQIRKFNEGKACWRTVPHCACSPAKYKNMVESKKSFVFFGNFELGNAITEDGESTGYRYNVKKEPVVWAGTADPKHPDKGVLKNGKDCYAWDCETERAKENFIAVYYDIPKTGFFSIRNTQTTEFWSGRETAFDFCPMINWEHLDESPLWNISKEKAFLVELIKEGGQKIVLAYLKAKNSNFDWSRLWTDEEIITELKKETDLPEDWSL